MSARALDVSVSFDANVPAPIAAFLAVPTPQGWIQQALAQLDTLLIDHANCEKKAAATAMSTLHRYPDHPELVYRMSRLAREELRHFEQVNAIMVARGIKWHFVAASRYASRLRAGCSGTEPHRLRDMLICGAFIEARSCERFAALVDHLDDELARFYAGLLASEARHFEHYLALAKNVEAQDFDERVAAFRELERVAIVEPDDAFSFHSGPPAESPSR